jgi:hypothetical protein
MERLAALEAFWEKVTVRAPFFPDLVRPYALSRQSQFLYAAG